jgi:uncharacterized protein (TIGR02588 family)
MSTENEEKEKRKEDKKNVLEWIVFSISLLLIVGTIGYLGYKTYTHQPSPPDIIVRYSPNPTDNAPYRYHLVIQNIGGETAEEVLIELILQESGRTIERSEVRLSFVPQQSKQESWVNFTNDPALADTILAKVVSFKKP